MGGQQHMGAGGRCLLLQLQHVEDEVRGMQVPARGKARRHQPLAGAKAVADRLCVRGGDVGGDGAADVAGREPVPGEQLVDQPLELIGAVGTRVLGRILSTPRHERQVSQEVSQSVSWSESVSH